MGVGITAPNALLPVTESTALQADICNNSREHTGEYKTADIKKELRKHENEVVRYILTHRVPAPHVT